MKNAAPASTPASRKSRATQVAADAPRPVVIRPVKRGDPDAVIDIEATVTGLEKRKYSASVYRRYGSGLRREQQFLVAQISERVVGFVIGEVRDWEFGSPPSGWVFAIDVSGQARQSGVGTQLLKAIGAGFRRAGVRKVRTNLARTTC